MWSAMVRSGPSTRARVTKRIRRIVVTISSSPSARTTSPLPGSGSTERSTAVTAARRARSPARRARRVVLGVSLAAAVISCGGDASGPRDAEYVGVLTSANERPPRHSGASGRATIHVTGNVARYSVTASGLADAATAVFLLIGGPETVGGQGIARLQLVAPAGTVTSGTIAAGTLNLSGAITFNNTTISGDSLRTLLERGATYVNVYTAAFPGGGVRGQVERQP